MPRAAMMWGVLTPLPEPGAPLSQITSRGATKSWGAKRLAGGAGVRRGGGAWCWASTRRGQQLRRRRRRRRRGRCVCCLQGPHQAVLVHVTPPAAVKDERRVHAHGAVLDMMGGSQARLRSHGAAGTLRLQAIHRGPPSCTVAAPRPLVARRSSKERTCCRSALCAWASSSSTRCSTGGPSPGGSAGSPTAAGHGAEAPGATTGRAAGLCTDRPSATPRSCCRPATHRPEAARRARGPAAPANIHSLLANILLARV